MATSFNMIYKKFLTMIDDYELGLITEAELQEVLFGYLDIARSIHFEQCSKDLEAITESKGVGEFQADLTGQEQTILAMGMKKVWISGKLNNADLMTVAIGDRDYKAVQGTQYLKELSKLDKDIEEEIRKYAVQYTYKGFSTEAW